MTLLIAILLYIERHCPIGAVQYCMLRYVLPLSKVFCSLGIFFFWEGWGKNTLRE